MILKKKKDIICGNNCNNNNAKVQCGMDYGFECEIEQVSVIDNNYTNIYWECDQDNIYNNYVCDNTDYIDLICAINGGNKHLISQVKIIED